MSDIVTDLADVSDAELEHVNNPLVIPDTWKTNSRHIYEELARSLAVTGNLAPLLPLLFRWAAKPVTLEEHYPLEVCFYHKRPRRMIKKCGRQIGKSFQNALELLLRALLIPNWNILYVTPLFEQVRRFSTQYVAALIHESPAKRLMTLKGASSQVLQRTLSSHSTIYFTYAQRDANRARGINAHEVGYDEVQLMTRDVFPVLQQVMGGSPYGEYETFAGTPLSHQNYSEILFRQSSMSEWMIKCRSCGKDNIAAHEFDLMKMIGPVHDGIHPGGVDPITGAKIKRFPGLVCAYCSRPGAKEANIKPLFPEDGHWWHRAPEQRNAFLGIHVPQPIMPWHAYSRDRWLKLNNRIAVGSEGEVLNEILGESCDSSFKPITVTDLKRAAILHKNTVSDAFSVRNRYTHRILGIDWGGGGMTGLSRTKAAIVGISPSGKTDVIFGVDLNFAHRPYDEVRVLMVLAMKFGCTMIAHDVGGGVGATRESMMYQTSSLNAEIWPMSYVGPMSGTMAKPRAGTLEGETMTWVVDKANSLSYLCAAIKQGHIRTFQYDFVSDDNPGLLADFTSLTSEIAHRVAGSDVMLIDREDGMSDDFAHACNLACVAGWIKTGAWPKLSQNSNLKSLQEIANTTDLVRSSANYTTDDIEQMLKSVSSGR